MRGDWAEGTPMGEAATNFLLAQLRDLAPVLVVYLVAIVLALVYLGRARGAALLTLAGVGVSLVTVVGLAAAQGVLVESHQAGDLEPVDFARQIRAVGLAGSWAHAVGLALLVAAVFVGRRSARGRASSPGGGP